MKKTLVALAAMSAVASFAQSSVVLSGNFDFASVSKSGTVANANGNTVTTGMGTSSTSTIKITATEDLGGGLKAFGMYELDPRTLSDDSLGVNLQSNTFSTAGSTTSAVSTNTGLARGEAYVGLSGGFGMVKLGAINAPGQDAVGGASALGTGIGSGYQINAATNSGIQAAFNVRYGRSLRYDSPKFNGFGVAVQHAPGNDLDSATDSTALAIPNNRNVTEFGLTYSNGPLNLAYANIAQAKQNNITGFYTPTSSSYPAAATNTNIFSGSYNVGSLTGYATIVNGNGLAATTTALTVNGFRGALKVNMGKVDLIGQYTEMKVNNGVETISKVTGARVDYNLSKTAAAYLGYESADTGAASANQLNIMSLGVRKSF